MGESTDTNAAIWQSGEVVQTFVAEAQASERKRAPQRRLMADLLPFGAQDAFTFLDLGAGTGAASRAILEIYPGSTAILADFSAEMMLAGEDEMRPFAGRYRYVEFDMTTGQWPDEIPAELDAIVTSMCVHHLTDERNGAAAGNFEPTEEKLRQFMVGQCRAEAGAGNWLAGVSWYHDLVGGRN